MAYVSPSNSSPPITVPAQPTDANGGLSSAPAVPDISTEVIDTPQAPPWFTLLNQQMIQMENRIMTKVNKIANRQRGSGRGFPYEIILFPDGSDPTGPNHNLPPLVNIDVVSRLTEPQLLSYLTGYGVNFEEIPDYLSPKNFLSLTIGGIVEWRYDISNGRTGEGILNAWAIQGLVALLTYSI